jgi:hypothetical protein
MSFDYGRSYSALGAKVEEQVRHLCVTWRLWQSNCVTLARKPWTFNRLNSTFPRS